MSKLKLQVPVGTRDFPPGECARKRNLEATLRQEFSINGYDEIETPAYEYYDVFMHDAVPYVQESMIKFFDHKGRILALRPDMTGPIARMAATKPGGCAVQRLCYIGNVYGFKEGQGRSEATQAGIELIGRRGADADAEVIALSIQSLILAGIEDFKIDIGQVSFFKGLADEAELALDTRERVRQLIDSKNSVELEYELSRLNMDDSLKKTLLELPGLFGGVEVLDRAKELSRNETCTGALANIKDVYDILCDFGYGGYISIDFGLLNDFNYYSGIIFRGVASGIGVPVLSGGRYDGLLREFGEECPATGFAIGILEVLEVLERHGALSECGEKVTVLRHSRENRSEAYAFAQRMRDTGKRVVMEANGAEYDREKFDIITYE